jgi:hypothetical protein
MLHTDGLSYPIEVKRANKTESNKMDTACDIISSAPEPDHKAYVCVDSWYISKKIIETSLKKGFHFIGALRIDIVICPLGIKNKIKMFLNFIKNTDKKVVTIKKQKYRVYRYEGNLNFIDNAVVLICFKEGQDISKAKAFICTDMDLSNEEILNYYSKRWEIETYFRAAKNNLALQGYQVRSSKALDRYLILQMFVAMYCIHTGNGNLLKGLRKYQAKKEADRIEDMIDILISFLKEIISYLPIVVKTLSFNCNPDISSFNRYPTCLPPSYTSNFLSVKNCEDILTKGRSGCVSVKNTIFRGCSTHIFPNSLSVLMSRISPLDSSKLNFIP